MSSLQALLGLGVFIGVAYAVSEDRTAVRWRAVAIDMALQVALGVARGDCGRMLDPDDGSSRRPFGLT